MKSMMSWAILAVIIVARGTGAELPTVYFRSDGGHASEGATLPSDLTAVANQRWRRPVEPGHSTPCLYGDRLFLTTFRREEERLSTVAVDRHTGHVLWEQTAPRREIEPHHQVGSPAVASPACDGECVYVFFGSFGLLAYDLSGQLVWSRALGPFQDEFGSASSPIVVDDLVVLNEDHDTHNALSAFNTLTGDLVWQVPRNEFTRSYATPIVVNVDDGPQIVVAGALTLTGYDLKTGDRRWWVHGLARIVNTTPAANGDTLYVATWSPGGDAGERITMEDWETARQRYDVNADGRIRGDELSPGPVLDRFFRIDLNQDEGIDESEWRKQAEVFRLARNSLFAVTLGGTGELAADRIKWKYAKGVPYVASPLYHEGIVFMVKDGGILTSLDAASGQVLKQGRLKGRGNYYASPVVGDGKLYFASEQGVVTVVSAEGNWQILGSRDFGETIYATPVLQDGHIYLRTSAALYCFEARGS